MSERLKPVDLEMIEQGQLLKDLNVEFAKIQAELCEHVEEWGERAKGAKAMVALKLTVCCENPKDLVYSIKGEVGSKPPPRPARTTVVLQSENDDGKPVLFGRVSGTTADHPDQGVLLTDDGRPIDQVTGEPVEAGTE